jgi:transporter family-2 protein
MSSAVIVPLLLGIISVLQAALNRRIASVWGLLPATLLNALVFTTCATVCVLFARTGKAPSADWMLPVSLRDMRAVWLVPGLFGLAIVIGLPWSLERMGALGTFVSMIAAQMVTSVAWDYFAEGVAMSWMRVLGAGLAIAGAALVALR